LLGNGEAKQTLEKFLALAAAIAINSIMKKWFPLFVVSFLIGTATDLRAARDVLIQVETPASVRLAANQANELVKKGDLEGARRLYDVAIKGDPKFYLAIYSRGEISMRQHKWELAAQDFNAALKISPGFFLAAIRRGEANERLGRYELRACHALSRNKAALELAAKFTEKEKGRNYFERYHI
jgi:tetratricopeptide (TPR) repeat protein